MTRTRQAYSYSCVMAVLPEPLAARLRGFSALIPDVDVYDDESGEKGREDDPHITLKYGLHTEDPDEVWNLFRGMEPAEVTLGDISAFVQPDYIVLKVEVESPDLHRFNRMVSKNLECTDTFRDYRPHATLAYMRHNSMDPYYWRRYCCGMFTGERVLIDRLRFTTADGRESWFPFPTTMEYRVARSFRAVHQVS